MRRTLLVAVTVGVAAAFGVATTAFGSEADDDARLWAQMLERTRAGVDAEPFSGIVQVEWRDPDGLHREAIEVNQSDGVVQVSDGAQVVSSTADRVVGAGEAMAVDADAAPLPALAAGKYDIERSAGPKILGRSTTQLDAILRSTGALVARVLVDKKTGLVLRRKTFDSDGRVLRKVSFTRIDDDADVTDVTVPTAPDVPVATDEIDPPYRAPSRIGAGFRRVGQWEHADGTRQLYYSDGLLGVSVFEQAGRLDWSALPDAQLVADVDGHPARRYALPVGETWVFERDGVVYTVVGDVPPEQLASVASDVSAQDDPLTARIARVALSPFRW